MRARHLLRSLIALLVVSAVAFTVHAAADSAAELPRASVELSAASPSGRTIAVPATGDLQAALNRAQPGDMITLAAGGTYVGPFTLPRKSGTGWITLRTDAPDDKLAPGRRVGPADASLMPKLVAASGVALSSAPGAHHYRFVGLEIRPREGTFIINLVDVGSGATSVSDLPHHIVFDRCYLHGDPGRGARRGIALNAREAAVVDSHLSDFKEAGGDSQAIAVWNGPGPFLIVNNHLAAAGENVMFGGADPRIADLVPSDIEIRQNHFVKPLGWKAGEPGYEGTTWTVKNLLELKNARRVLVKDNLFEHNWAQAQSGFAILFTVRNQDGRAPWSVVEDVTFTDNVIRHAAAGVNILGRDDSRPSQPARRIVIRNNLFEDVGGSRWGGGTLFQILNGAAKITIEHNTAFQTGSIIMAEGPPNEGFVYRDNIAPHNAHGITGTGTAPGTGTLERYFPGAVFEGNVIVGGSAGRYPRQNFFPGSLDDVGFGDLARRDYRLAEGSRYRGSAGGPAPGADMAALARAEAAAAPPMR
jgi:hypothetical protein